MYCFTCNTAFQSRAGFRRHKSRYPCHDRCDWAESSAAGAVSAPTSTFRDPWTFHDPSLFHKFFRSAWKRQQPQRPWAHLQPLCDPGLEVHDWRCLYLDRSDATLWTVYIDRQHKGAVVWEPAHDVITRLVDPKGVRRRLQLTDRHVRALRTLYR